MSADNGGIAAAPRYVLEAKGLCRSFGGFRAVDALNLSVVEGSVHALIGPNGAGKTTVFNLLTKFLPASAGAIYFRGRDITKIGPADVARLGIVRSFQISATFGQLTTFENVRIALQSKNGLGWQFWRSRETLSVLNERTWELLEMVGLAYAASTIANELPYGRKRALELATTLALEPDVMLLDEPMAGLAHTDIPEISRLIDRARAGRTVLMVEHNLDVVEEICDSVTVLQRGRTLCEGSYSEVSADPSVREAYMGLEDDE
ncbi:ABC transporter ATP-binding protein [Sulfitobacter pacificus]|uniref:ABC transporter ATP-binding protein n=1 Tax=Sulfitobacter pacificus TaxID=1499314 RepID=A0ABQ5VPP8_9RHOB|nr:ABC transporter ATP-binding protein [Sulfitobacter pacificus]GLQ29196.1 ABC transporter ATP-binding protein [Sulfitobacter pacificus]